MDRRQYLKTGILGTVPLIAGCTGILEDDELESGDESIREGVVDNATTDENTETETETEEEETETETPEPESFLEKQGEYIITETRWLATEMPDARTEYDDLLEQVRNTVTQLKDASDPSTETVDTLENQVLELFDLFKDIGSHYDQFDDLISIFEEKHGELFGDIRQYAELGDTDNLEETLNKYEKRIPTIKWSHPSGSKFKPVEYGLMEPRVYGAKGDAKANVFTGLAASHTKHTGEGANYEFSVVYAPDFNDYFGAPLKGTLDNTSPSKLSSYYQHLVPGNAETTVYWRTGVLIQNCNYGTDCEYSRKKTRGVLLQYQDEEQAQSAYDNLLSNVQSDGTTSKAADEELTVGETDKIAKENPEHGEVHYMYSKQEGSCIVIFGANNQPWDEKKHVDGWIETKQK